VVAEAVAVVIDSGTVAEAVTVVIVEIDSGTVAEAVTVVIVPAGLELPNMEGACRNSRIQNLAPNLDNLLNQNL